MRVEEKLEIRALPLFQGIMPQTFEALTEAAYSHAFPPRLDLIQQGDKADFLHIVVEGTVELYARWTDQEAVMGLARPVSTFILAACVRDRAYLMSARTLERSRVVMIPSGALRTAMRRDPDLAIAVIADLSESYRNMVGQTKNLKLRNARERIAAWVLGRSRELGDVASFTLPVEKRHLASFLGMAPESLSRALREMSAHGLRMDGGRVIITDRARLLDLARLDPLIDLPAD